MRLFTLLKFNPADTTEKRCADFLKSLGSSVGKFTKVMLMQMYQDAVDVGEITSTGNYQLPRNSSNEIAPIIKHSELQEKIKEYQKPFDTTEDDSILVYLNWSATAYDDMYCFLILTSFKGGVTKFITECIKYFYSPIFELNGEFYQYKRKTRADKVINKKPKEVKPKVSAAAERPASAPTPISVDTEDDGVNPASLLTQFNDSGEYSSLINADDNKTTDDRILADNEDPSLQFK